MITAKFTYGDQAACVVIVLEPAGFIKLMDGNIFDKNIDDYFSDKPIPNKVRVILAYSPDSAWIEQQLEHRHPDNLDEFMRLLSESLERTAIVRVSPTEVM